MICATVKSNVIELPDALTKIIIGIRDPVACACDIPVRDTVPLIAPTYVLEIYRKGQTTLVGIFPKMPINREDGNTEFLIDPAFFTNPSGLYTGIIKRTYDGRTTEVGPPITIWLRPPHTHDGVFTSLAGATYGDENPS